MQRIQDAIQQGNVAYIQERITEGFTLNTPLDEFGNTILSEACKHNKTKIVEFLLSQPGIDVNQSTKNGTSPLYTACSYGNVECVRLLLQRNDLDVNYNNYMTSLMIICQHFSTTSTGERGDAFFEMLTLILQRPDINLDIVFGPDNQTALEFMLQTYTRPLTSNDPQRRRFYITVRERLKAGIMLFVEKVNRQKIQQWEAKYKYIYPWFASILREEGRTRNALLAQQTTFEQDKKLPTDMHGEIKTHMPEVELQHKTSLKF
tara:strand:+ start:40 stop:825 length:786 start_codon:yes stop_codon:yes gene_type:complete